MYPTYFVRCHIPNGAGLPRHRTRSREDASGKCSPMTGTHIPTTRMRSENGELVRRSVVGVDVIIDLVYGIRYGYVDRVE